MEYSRAKTIDKYFEKIDSEELDFSQLRDKLEAEKIPQDEISIVVDLVNKKVIRTAVEKANHSKGVGLLIGGLSFAVLGILVMLLSYFRILDLGGFALIPWGPIATGLLLALKGKFMMR